MPTISEGQLSTWTKPAFGNEEENAEYTESTIRQAVNAHPFLKTIPTRVFAKGSYKNNTNVRRDSDVDVAVEYTGIIYPTYGPDANTEEVDRTQGLTPYSGPFQAASGDTDIQQFKNAVGEAMASAFGSASVTRHNKVFTVREGSYRGDGVVGVHVLDNPAALICVLTARLDLVLNGELVTSSV